MKINKICDYKGLKIGKPNTQEATKEELEQAINNFLSGNMETIVKEDAAKLGDTVTIDFEGFLDGKPFEGGKGEKYDLGLGSHTFIPGFEDQLVGHKAGEDVDVNVTFPENYQAENLKGKPVVFKCKIHAVKEFKTPTLDDDFAKKFNMASAEELKAAIKEKVFFDKSQKDLNEYLNKFWDKVSEESDIDFEDSELKAKMDKMYAYYAESMRNYGISMEDYLKMVNQTEEQFRENIKPEAIKTTKIDVILDHIKTKENIVITDEDVNQELENLKRYYGLQDEQIEQMKKTNLDNVKKDIEKSRVCKFILDNND